MDEALEERNQPFHRRLPPPTSLSSVLALELEEGTCRGPDAVWSALVAWRIPCPAFAVPVSAGTDVAFPDKMATISSNKLTDGRLSGKPYAS